MRNSKYEEEKNTRQTMGNREKDLLQKGREPRDGGQTSQTRERDEKELRCVMHRHLLTMRNVFIAYFKHVPIKQKIGKPFKGESKIRKYNKAFMNRS